MSAIRYQINIDAPLRKVWNALTTVEGVTGWWVDDARIDCRAGGRLVLTSEDDDGEPLEEHGIFHTLRPTRRIEIKWDKSSPGENRGTTVLFQMARFRDETRVSLIQSGEDVLADEEYRAQLEKSWRRALKGLRSYLEA